MIARAIGYAALTVLWMAPMWLHPAACPFGLHDWAMPCFPEQRADFFASLFAPWSQTNLGVPQFRPQVNLPFAILGACVALSPAIGLRAFLLGCGIGAGIAADVAAQRLFSIENQWARFAAGVVYVASPFFAVKLASGHIGFLIDAALLPAALSALVAARDGGRRAWCACALLAASALAQIQAGAIVLVLCFVLGYRRVSQARLWAIAVVALVAWLPVVFCAIVAFKDGALATELQLRSWIASESVPWAHALDATAYFAGYFHEAAPWYSILAWEVAAPVCVVVALARAGSSRRIAIATIGLGLVAAGTTGPLAVHIEWALAHVPASSIVRDLYDLLALAPLAIAGGAATIVQSIARLGPARRAVAAPLGAAALAAVALLALPATTAGAAKLVPLWPLAEPYTRAATDIASEPGYDRVLWLPATVPLGPKGTTGGADPFQNGFGDHPSASAYHAAGLFAYIAALGDRTGAIPEWLARRTDVSSTITRPGIVSTRLSFAAHPEGEPVQPPMLLNEVVATTPLAFAPGSAACEPDLRSAMDVAGAFVRCDARAVATPHGDAAQDDDPGAGWVDGERWALLDPQLANPRWPVIFTRSRAAYSWNSAAQGWTLVYAPEGAMLDGARIAPRATWQTIRTRSGLHELHAGGSLVALSATLAPVTVPRHSAAQREEYVFPSAVDRGIGAYDAVLAPHPSGLLILREGWSPRWRLTIDGRDLGSPVFADGFASGWRIGPSSKPAPLAIRYGPATPYLALCALTAVVTLLLFCGALLPEPRSARPASTPLRTGRASTAPSPRS